ncbi:MAG: bifunctional riboflavin kinase/FAD synthetase [Gammaproteobacteria bacterium]|nr:bifunctional riboflavin kinase/FAD synthetase [Gammaproteobacteria bacterium]
MHVIRRPRPGAALPAGCVATIGVFDGLHVGHRGILARVLAAAAHHGVPSLVFSFEPTPQEVMSPGTAPARLMRFREKVMALRDLGVDVLFCPPFERAMQELSPVDFITRLLVGVLGVRHLVVGDDFRFGHRRGGGFADLESGGRRHGFSVEQAGSVIRDGVRVSSTAVRTALAAGDLDRARRMLGGAYRMVGRVGHGRRLGRELGFPTANLRLGRIRSPVCGIFAVRIHGAGVGIRDGVASLGTRPTVAGREPLLEVHVFDFDGNLYGCELQVEFIARIRDEALFPDLAALRRQMEADAREARRLLAAAATERD